MDITRRRVLQGMGAGAVFAPFVPIFHTEGADGDLPRRVIFLYSSNGTVYDDWKPTMDGTTLVLSPILELLEPYKSRLLVVDGLRYAAALDNGWTGHFGGMTTMLTGCVPAVPPGIPLESGEAQATSLSVDQHIAATIGQGLKFPSLETAILSEAQPGIRYMSWAGEFQWVPQEENPANLYGKIFQGFMDPGKSVDPAAAARLADQKTILDRVAADVNRMSSRLAQPEREKMQRHLEAIHEIEESLFTGVGDAATDSCEQLADVAIDDPYYNEHIPQTARRHMDLLVMAMACDMTRVGSIQYGRAGATHQFVWLGEDFQNEPENGAAGDGTTGIHGLAHDADNPESRAKLTQCHRWYGGEMAYLLSLLDAIPEGNGTMLDNTLVVWCNEMGTGFEHGLDNTPWVLAGNVGGFFETGRVVSFAGESHARLLLSLCHAMGLQDTTFGAPGFCSGPLPGL